MLPKKLTCKVSPNIATLGYSDSNAQTIKTNVWVNLRSYPSKLNQETRQKAQINNYESREREIICTNAWGAEFKHFKEDNCEVKSNGCTACYLPRVIYRGDKIKVRNPVREKGGANSERKEIFAGSEV